MSIRASRQAWVTVGNYKYSIRAAALRFPSCLAKALERRTQSPWPVRLGRQKDRLGSQGAPPCSHLLSTSSALLSQGTAPCKGSALLLWARTEFKKQREPSTCTMPKHCFLLMQQNQSQWKRLRNFYMQCSINPKILADSWHIKMLLQCSRSNDVTAGFFCSVFITLQTYCLYIVSLAYLYKRKKVLPLQERHLFMTLSVPMGNHCSPWVIFAHDLLWQS